MSWNEYVVAEKEVGPFVVRVYHDEDPGSSPRDWCNLTVIRGWHRRYEIGDGPNIDSDNYDGWDDMLASIIEEHDAVMVAPLYWYEHSGVSCKMGSPITIGDNPNESAELARFRAQCMDSGGWDSGVAGLVIVPRAQQEQVGTPDDLIVQCAREEVDTYAAFLEGRVYYWTVSYASECDHGDTHEDDIDSCGGYVGEDDFALSEGVSSAEGTIDSIVTAMTRVLA